MDWLAFLVLLYAYVAYLSPGYDDEMSNIRLVEAGSTFSELSRSRTRLCPSSGSVPHQPRRSSCLAGIGHLGANDHCLLAAITIGLLWITVLAGG